ncbi:Pre-rRNA-processing protein TSR1 [Blattella germanica]|nr:Pre-rRNA-processing protein TSR1 [Blattella germanica]
MAVNMVADTVQERHRPGSLKQQNKAHKHGKHRSKGAIDSAIKGRTSAKEYTKKARHELKKYERRNKAIQLRQKKRDEILSKKRSLGGASSAPFLVAIVPLCEDIDPVGALEFLKQADEEAVITNSQVGTVHISVPRFKQRFSIVIPPQGDLYSTLDALKVADTALFLVSASYGSGIDEFGESILTSSLAQGLPSTVVAKRHDGKQLLQKTVSRWLPEEKISTLSRTTDALTVLRRIGSQKQRSVFHRDKRPHMLAEGNLGTLKVTGYVRGQPLSVNSLVHIPGWGDFQMSQMEAPDDPHSLETGRKGQSKEENMDEVDQVNILEKADTTKQESLQSENIPDPMDAEQTWPTAEELAEAEREANAKKRKEVDASDVEDEDEDVMNVDMDPANEEASSDEEDAEEDEIDFDTVTITDAGNDVERYDEKMDMAEEEETMKKIKEARMEQLFPDELDTPQDIAARIRFQKYRGLHLRTLIVHPGWYVTLHVIGVPQHLYNSRQPNYPIVLIGMLPHEQKMSVLNFYERFFQPDATVVASVFAPIMFPPSPVLVFKEKKDGSHELVGAGNLLSVNPDRIVAKRAVLSGHPFKVHKRSAVIRFMFFNREDIDWFKPVELRTKYGRRGHIKEPLGTHGHMKCIFDGQLKSQDTVLMNLYKRVYPKWTYEPYVNSPLPFYDQSAGNYAEPMV